MDSSPTLTGSVLPSGDVRDALSDPTIVEDIGQALAELESGDVLSTDEVLAALPASRRGTR
jgi:hypothetical protein